MQKFGGRRKIARLKRDLTNGNITALEKKAIKKSLENNYIPYRSGAREQLSQRKVGK